MDKIEEVEKKIEGVFEVLIDETVKIKDQNKEYMGFGMALFEMRTRIDMINECRGRIRTRVFEK